MLIKRLYLRNFRVYEDELDLELPPGLVGIYGPNGAGKSTLLEAILFTLWGKARTTKDQIRSSGVGGECVTEVEFEHEGHLYLVRRSLKGINSQVSVEAHCDGALMSTGTRDAERFVESVLGMDDAAFRASVFTEQKQLAAFSNHSPAERRRLVLQLLGITPLDAARDAARKDARDLTSDHERLRGMLPDLEQLHADAEDGAARAAAAEVAAGEEANAADTARRRCETAEEAFRALDVRRQEYEGLVVEGRHARQELDTASQAVEARTEELRELESVAAQLAALEAEAAGVEDEERLLEPLAAAAAAARSTAAAIVPARPADPAADEEAVRRAADRTRSRHGELAAATAFLQAAEAEYHRASQAATRSSTLTGEGECPTCGQPLGDAFETVQAHRVAEVDQAAARKAERVAEVARLTGETGQSDAEYERLTVRRDAARAALAEWEQSDRRRRDAEEHLHRAWQQVLAVGTTVPGPWHTDHAPTDHTPDHIPTGESSGSPRAEGPIAPPPAEAEMTEALAALRASARAKRHAANRAVGIRARLEGRTRVERALSSAQDQMASLTTRVEVLRDKVRALDFRPDSLQAAADERDATRAAAEAAATRAQQAAVDAAADRQRALGAVERLDEGRAQHGKLADLESEARHRARAADLLSEFRNTVVASVGPRLAVQAADLFGELTDHEYDKIDVDPETYQLQISDGGLLYGLDRFSGSEVDLANLALRVAISEHIHFQSGGSVGLLVLDEVFGPLDEDRKTRMLMALERLKGRFRQVLVVTHDSDIKEQLPHAVEVVKRPGRRATAQVLGD